MIGPAFQLRGPSGPRFEIRTGWMHVYLRGVPISGVHMNAFDPKKMRPEALIESAGRVALMGVAQCWSPKLAEILGTINVEYDQ